MLDSQPPRSPPPPPDVGGCQSFRSAELQSEHMPISGDAVDTLSRPFWPSSKPISLSCRSRTGGLWPSSKPISLSCRSKTGGLWPTSKPISLSCRSKTDGLWPSSKPISLSCRSMTGRNPNPLPSRKLLLTPTSQPTSLSPGTSLLENLAAPRSQLTATEGTIGTSPSRYPPWAPPRRYPKRSKLKNRTTTASPPLHPPQGRQPTYQEHRRNNSDSDLAPEKRRKTSTATAAAERKKGEACEGLSQEEAAEGQLDSDSPLRKPHPPLVPIWTSKSGKVYRGLTNDWEALDMYHQACRKYHMKQACQAELPTLKSSRTNPHIKEGYSLKQKEIFFNAAKSILSLSANLDGVEINRCSGVVLELDATKNSAIILTSAWLICTNKPFDEWSDKKYAPEAKVTVHLLDGTTVDGELLYFSKHYDVAFYEILEGSHLQTLPLEPDLENGQDLFVLARDTNMDLICKTVQVNYVDPCEYQHNHYMFISGSIPKCGTGGTLVDLNGKIVGMLFDTLPLTAFIPSSLIIRCLGLLRQFGRVVRPQLGLKLGTVGFLDMADIDLLGRRYGVTSGLIVGEVSAGCFAERVGIRRGDVILSCRGVRISSLAQLEEILLDIGEKHFEKGNDQSSEVNVEICVFHVCKGTQRVINLTLKLSDGTEVFHSG